MKPPQNRQHDRQQDLHGGRCKLIRRRLFGWSKAGHLNFFDRSPIDLEAGWVRTHVAGCPRCQRRFSSYGKVQLGLTLLKSEAHRLDLLSKANVATLGVLKHSLREAPAAMQLKSALPRPRLIERLRTMSQPVLQTAACAVILLLSKTGLYASIENTQRQGQRAVRQYYDDRLGEGMTRDVFDEA